MRRHTLTSFIADPPALLEKLKSILQHLLRTLPVAGENYLIVFKLIHDLCQGEVCLSPSDITLLEKQVKQDLNGKDSGKEAGQEASEEDGKKDAEVDYAATPTNSGTPILTLIRGDDEEEVKSKVDSRAEVNRLFQLLKTEAKPQDSQPKPPFAVPTTPPKKAEKRAWRKPLFQPGFGGPWLSPPPEAPSEDPLVTVCRGVVDEMDIGNELLQFCWNLPVIQELSRAQTVFPPQPAMTKDANGDEGEAGIAPLIKRFVRVTIRVGLMQHRNLELDK